MDVKTLNKIKSKFTFPPQNWNRILKLWENDQPITFYSWECPPRQIKNDKKYGQYVNFDLDIASIVNNKKLDNYTELPRLTTQWQQEKWFIKTIVKPNLQASYLKIIADTNGLYLYPKSKKILGEKKIASLSLKFKLLLEKKSKTLLKAYSPPIYLYTYFQQKYKTEYETFFNLLINDFDRKQPQIIPQNIIDYWTTRIPTHVGLSEKDQQETADLLKRVIASYATEGMLFELLNQSSLMPNPVWINWEEPPPSVQTTEILRSRYGLKPLPVIYFVKSENPM